MPLYSRLPTLFKGPRSLPVAAALALALSSGTAQADCSESLYRLFHYEGVTKGFESADKQKNYHDKELNAADCTHRNVLYTLDKILASRDLIPEKGVMHAHGVARHWPEWVIPLLARTDITLVASEPHIGRHFMVLNLEENKLGKEAYPILVEHAKELLDRHSIDSERKLNDFLKKRLIITPTAKTTKLTRRDATDVFAYVDPENSKINEVGVEFRPNPDFEWANYGYYPGAELFYYVPKADFIIWQMPYSPDVGWVWDNQLKLGGHAYMTTEDYDKMIRLKDLVVGSEMVRRDVAPEIFRTRVETWTPAQLGGVTHMENVTTVVFLKKKRLR